MRINPAILASMVTLASAGPAFAAPEPLSPADKAAGWVLLTGADGGQHWRGYRQDAFPSQGWTLKDGVLTHAAGGGGGDIVTADEYGDFELVFEFKAAPKANSGVIYRVSEQHDYCWMTGPEFQVLDDAGHGLAPDHPHSAGAMYDLVTPSAGKTVKPAGEWNEARIYMRNGVVQHWLNGAKAAEARFFNDDGTPDRAWLGTIARSKFKPYEGFGLQTKGHIALQDHGDEVAYRNVKVRDLSEPMPGEVRLFNGKNADGWVGICPELGTKHVSPMALWRVEDGILICSGEHPGYIRTEKDYTNFILRLEWRFNPETKQAGNSGVLVRMVGEDKVWPKSVEAQLMSGRAGDFWNIGDFAMTTDPDRTNGRNTRHTHGAERAVGEWNEYEITVNKGDVILKVNGEELNRAWDVEEVPGKICLQSEGVEIQFRNVRLVELP